MPPLPPLSPDSTPRGYIEYTSGGISHVMSARFPVGTAFGTIDNALAEICDNMLPLMLTSDSIGSRKASDTGSNVQFIVGTDGRAGTSGSGTINDINQSVALSITGKGTDGRLVAVSFFNIPSSVFVDTRLPIGVVSAPVADFYAAITANTIEPLVNIGDATVNWNSYLNVRRDAYWQRKTR